MLAYSERRVFRRIEQKGEVVILRIGYQSQSRKFASRYCSSESSRRRKSGYPTVGELTILLTSFLLLGSIHLPSVVGPTLKVVIPFAGTLSQSVPIPPVFGYPPLSVPSYGVPLFPQPSYGVPDWCADIC